MTTNPQSPIALITGASRGLGRNTALALAKRGVDSVVTFRSNKTEAEAVVAEIERLGARALALPLDVGDSTSFPRFVEQLQQGLSRMQRERIQFVVNNAGVGAYAPFAQTTEAQFDSLMNVHLKGTFFLTQRLLPLIADGGRILNVSSGLTRFSMPGFAAYATMKGAVEVLTHYLALELGPRKISVNTLAPGAIETDFGGGMVRDNAGVNKAIADQTALGRVGLPDDIGGVVALLLAPESGWINGQRIEVSGGVHL